MTTQGETLVTRLVEFGRALRAEGAEVGAARTQHALEALGAVDPAVRHDVYWALRATLVSSVDEIAVFDRAFGAFWEAEPSRAGLGDPVSREGSASAPGGESGDGRRHRRATVVDDDEGEEGDSGLARGRSWSPAERLAELDFREYGAEELERSRRTIERLARALPCRRSRRMRAAKSGRVLDRGRMLRAAVRTGGHPLEREWRRRRVVPRKLIFLVDVSGSMEPYARAIVMFLHAAVRAGGRVEAFSFGTRLTPLTAHLQERHSDAVERAMQAVPDWAGGTRIGENLQEFNRCWARPGAARGAAVVIVSDGWERGNVGLLAREMEALQRHAHRLVWVNPLAGDPEYEPLALGMAAALPYVDLLFPGHNLRSLEALVEVLEALSMRRSGAVRGRLTAALA